MDTRVQYIFDNITENDNSFTPDNFLDALFGKTKWNKSEVKEIWHNGIKTGIQEGLLRSSIEGQIVKTIGNINDQRHKMFYERFLQLAKDFNCQITYHPLYGMKVVDLDPLKKSRLFMKENDIL